MASSSFPRPGHNVGSVTNYEHELLAKKATPDGLHGFPTDPAPIYADSAGIRTVRLRAGVFATIRGSIFMSGPTDITLPQLAANTSGNPRIDLVVLRLSRADYAITPTVLTGVPSGNPVAPTRSFDGSSTGFFDFPLGEVRVASGASSLASNTITIRGWYLGSDGQIRCTPDTRPPHEAGRVIWEHPTGQFVSTGDRWLRVADEASGAIAVFGGFSHSNAVLHRRNGHVTFALTAWRPTAMSANTEYRCANVPDGFRPVTHMSTVGIVPSTGSVFTCSVGTDGAVLMNPGVTSIPGNRACVLGSMTYPHA